ncbi:MAG TPA: hypothetical protein DCZ48_15050 [Methylococcaceae bacterium]|nr:hypothetical protein [Methylococcaceae bacterium]
MMLKLMKFSSSTICSVLLIVSKLSYANELTVIAGSAKELDLVSDNRLHLHANDVYLHQLIDTLAERSGVTIHYDAVLPKLVNVDCKGDDVFAILQCIVGEEVSWMFRYSDAKGKADELKNQDPSEIWILATEGVKGAEQYASVNTSDCQAGADSILPEARQANHEDNNFHDSARDVEEQVKRLNADEPERRVEALASLARLGETEEPYIRDLVDQSLLDSDPAVRAQAIYALSQIEKDASLVSVRIQQALDDPDIGVRLMAIDAIDSNRVMLEHAAQNQDAMVSGYAKEKLEALVSQ